MHGQEKYASVPTRILGFARITASLDDEIRFTTVAPLTPPIAGLKNAKLPNSLIQFLLGLDKKLDMLLAHQYVEQLKNEYPLQLDIRKISGDTISFASIPEIPDNTALEVVMMLRQMPLQLAAAKGTAQKIQKGKKHDQTLLQFASIRDTDQEAVVSFVFEEQREHIRRQNKNT